MITPSTSAVLAPGAALLYPSVGVSRTLAYDTAPDVARPLLAVEGSGVVRSIWTTLESVWDLRTALPDGESATPDVRIRVYADSQGALDVSALTPTIDLPILLLAGCQWARPEGWTWPYLDRGLRLAISPRGLEFAYPMPFSDGITITLETAACEGLDFNSGYPFSVGGSAFSWVQYELGNLPSGLLRRQRLKGALATGASDADSQPFVLASEDDGAGCVVGLFGAQRWTTGSGQNLMLERNWQIATPSGDVLWQTSGTEDLFRSNGFYFENGVQEGPDAGLFFALEDRGDVEYWRVFEPGRAPTWADGVSLQLQGSSNVQEKFLGRFVTLYYQER